MRLGACEPALVAAAAIALAACSGQRAGGPTPLVSIDGSSSVFPIAEAVAEEFLRGRERVHVTVGISGTGGGFQKFCLGESDIATASRPIKATEEATCAANGIEFIELPVALDGIAILVNPTNDWAHTITTAELRRLWEPDAHDRVLTWSQVRPRWPDRPVHLFGPGPDSGTFDHFTEVIVGRLGATRGDFTASEDDNVLVQGIARDALALGYFGFAYYRENQDRLKVLAVQADPERLPVSPTPETIHDGRYAPLSRPVFIYVRRAVADRDEVRAFVDFFLSDGITLLPEVGFVPLADEEYRLVRDRFRRNIIGTMFPDGISGVDMMLAARLREATR